MGSSRCLPALMASVGRRASQLRPSDAHEVRDVDNVHYVDDVDDVDIDRRTRYDSGRSFSIYYRLEPLAIVDSSDDTTRACV